MVYRRNRKLILLPLLLASLSGCHTTPEENSVPLSVNADRYDSSDVTVASLESDFSMLFEDMYFVRGKDKDHVFRFKNGQIVDHVTCLKVKFDVKNFDDIVGEPFFNAIQKIGIPSFKGLEEDHSVTYFCKDGIERNLSLSLNDKSEWIVGAFKEKAINYELSNNTDINSRYRPSVARCQKVKMGMYLGDVLFLLGRPYVFSNSTATSCCWGLSSGGTFHVFQMNQREGFPFFDPSILERDDYFPTLKSTSEPVYWSVERVAFNERSVDEYPNGDVYEGLDQS